MGLLAGMSADLPWLTSGQAKYKGLDSPQRNMPLPVIKIKIERRYPDIVMYNCRALVQGPHTRYGLTSVVHLTESLNSYR